MAKFTQLIQIEVRQLATALDSNCHCNGATSGEWQTSTVTEGDKGNDYRLDQKWHMWEEVKVAVTAKVSEMLVIFSFLVFSILIPLVSHSGALFWAVKKWDTS